MRQKTLDIRAEIQQYVAEETQQIADLKAQIEGQEIEQREKTYAEIDKLEKAKVDKFEVILNEKLPEVFSIVKETARRFSENESIVVTATELDRKLANHPRLCGDKWRQGCLSQPLDGRRYRNHLNMVHYDVQLIGGVVLHSGKITEMATGEGKTLVATLPVFPECPTGNGVHVITVNDYLSKRDSEWMGPLYMFHGLTVDCIDKHQPNSEERRQAYAADITFGTNNESVLTTCVTIWLPTWPTWCNVVTTTLLWMEVDSVLIDDAYPLIIVGPSLMATTSSLRHSVREVENLWSCSVRWLPPSVGG